MTRLFRMAVPPRRPLPLLGESSPRRAGEGGAERERKATRGKNADPRGGEKEKKTPRGKERKRHGEKEKSLKTNEAGHYLTSR